jgi:predicted ATPase
MIPATANRRFILTGGPGCGKTATMDGLRAKGFVCVPEVARSVIQERITQGLPSRPSASEFANEIVAADRLLYDTISSDRYLFFDRGLVDSIGMLVECGEIDLQAAIAQLITRPYNRTVFFFPPWEAIYVTDSERDQTFEDSLEISSRIRTWYESIGFSLFEVPFGPPDDRASIILDQCGRHGSRI